MDRFKHAGVFAFGIEVGGGGDPNTAQHGGTQIGQDIAKEFLTYYTDYMNDTHTVNLGLFIDNSLVGFVQSFEQKNQSISTINIYVARMHREKGYAKRLLSAICATNENMVYCYSCVKNNIASFNTAKSCGFQFKGAYLFI